MRGRTAAIHRCYERALQRDATLGEGLVRVQFTVEESGSVRDVSAVENDVGDDTVAECVTNVVRRLRWSRGPHGGSVTYTYPFRFEP